MIADQEKPRGRLAQLEAGAEFANGLGGGERRGVGLGNDPRNDRVAENGLAEDDGGMRNARDAGVQPPCHGGVEGKPSGEGHLRLPVAKKGIDATGDGNSDDHRDKLMAQRNGRVHKILDPDRRSKASHLAIWRMLLK